MTKTALPKDANDLERLKMLLQVDLVARALFELLYPFQDYAGLLVINHSNNFISLSNEHYYLIVLPVKNKHLFRVAESYLKNIQNRTKLLAFLQGNSEITEKGVYRISAEQISERAVKNGIPPQNLFLKLLKELDL